MPYALPRNQSGSIGNPIWDPRSRTGAHLRPSKHHAGNVVLVLNIQTGHVSPQFHLILDENFATVEDLNSSSATLN